MKNIARLIAVIGIILCCCQLQAQDFQLFTDTAVASEEFPAFDPDIARQYGYVVTQAEDGTFVARSTAAATWESVTDLLRLFLFNLLVCWIIVHFFYYRKSRRSDYYFTFMLFSSAMFLLLFVMNNLSLQIGFTLGLFAIFGMIRYRTESVPIREMTYLFIIIALSIINGIGAEVPFAQIATANVVTIIIIALLESERILPRHQSVKMIVYDRIDLIVPEKRAELKADLEKRTGLVVKSIEIGKIDLLKDSAWIRISYTLPKGEQGGMDSMERMKNFQE